MSLVSNIDLEVNQDLQFIWKYSENFVVFLFLGFLEASSDWIANLVVYLLHCSFCLSFVIYHLGFNFDLEVHLYSSICLEVLTLRYRYLPELLFYLHKYYFVFLVTLVYSSSFHQI